MSGLRHQSQAYNTCLTMFTGGNESQTKRGRRAWEDDTMSSYHCPTHLVISNVILPQASRKGLNKSDSVSEKSIEHLAGVPKGEVSF